MALILDIVFLLTLGMMWVFLWKLKRRSKHVIAQSKENLRILAEMRGDEEMDEETKRKRLARIAELANEDLVAQGFEALVTSASADAVDKARRAEYYERREANV